ncbi:uncharacterized protein LOC107046648 [Diachasma alloeum]|uniref:uncharacterized protein LOC107046648 n=1 Tax=Diachasma alloeum TaxID=454923 RepID=UPI0010FAE800|nr:uncharacterized protein LOC107046648 [Diachasma alloeum]
MKATYCYCDICKVNVEKGKMKYFLTLSLENQLKPFLKVPNMKKILNYRSERVKKVEDNIKDIFDGQAYIRLQQENIISSSDFTYSFNTDGFNVHRSSGASAWPIFIIINEVPPNLRQKYMFLAELWYDKDEPNMNSYLKPFVEEANHLSSKGIRWKPDRSSDVTSKFIPTCCVVDSKCRCKLLGMAQYSGYYG